MVETDSRIRQYYQTEMGKRGLIVSVFLVLNLSVWAQTEVSGNLSADETWTADGSPYNVIGDVGVPSGMTLTIEAGVTVNYTGDFKVLVFGAIQVNGVEGNTVVFNGNDEQGTEYMLEVRRTNLDLSNIDYAEFTGPQGTLLVGLETDPIKNSGELNISNCRIDTSVIYLVTYYHASDSVTLFVSSCLLNNVKLTGSRYDNNLYPYIVENSLLATCSFEYLNHYFDRCQLSHCTFIGALFIDPISHVKINRSRLYYSDFSEDESINGFSVSSFDVDSTLFVDSPIFLGSYGNLSSISNSILVSTGQKDSVLIGNNASEIQLNNVQFHGSRVENGIYGQYQDGHVSLSNCTFYNLKNAINLELSQSSASNSNYIRIIDYNILSRSLHNIPANNCYWGVTTLNEIESKIYHSVDDLELGTVDYSNWLMAPNPDAPISPPQNVVKTDDGSGGLDISWAANLESDIAGYKVHWGAFDDFEFEHSVDVGDVLSHNLAGVALSDSVAVSVYDTGADGTNDLVEGHESWYRTAVTVPYPPTLLTLSDVAHNQFHVSWDTLGTANSYKIDVARDNEFEVFVDGYQNLDVNKPFLTVSDLMPFTTYYFRVRSVNAAGMSESSEILKVVTYLFTEFSSVEFECGSSSDWGDVDNDGDLDLLITGRTSEDYYFSKIYKNTIDGFVEAFDGQMTGVVLSSAALGDLDIDGDLDVLISGFGGIGNGESSIYLNNGNTLNEAYIGSLEKLYNSTINLGDLDNDGDLDILMTGNKSHDTFVSIAFENLKTEFQETFKGQINDVYAGSIDMGDLDSDGDLDVLLTGLGEVVHSKIYENLDNGLIEKFQGKLTPVSHGSVVLGDLDSDGDLDIVLTGKTHGDASVSKIYENTTNDIIELGGNPIDALSSSNVTLADIDSDGDLDIFISGYQDVYLSKTYLNNNMNYEEVSVGNIEGVGNGAVSWSDFDNDGDLDLMITGISNSSCVSKIYKNYTNLPNSVPSSPINLTSIVTSRNVNLSWDSASDLETPINGLNYNIYIGTSPGSQNIRPAHADLSTGYRRIVKRGDIQGTSWTIKNLEPGTYYWGVQAIDASYAGGQFSEEQSFVVTGMSSASDITDFSSSDEIRTSDINAVSHTVFLEVGSWANITSLIATFTLSPGATATVNGTLQVSGETANDFTNPVTYTVTAEDGETTQDWVVTVTKEDIDLNDATDFLTFSIPQQTSQPIINAGNHTILAQVSSGTGLSALVPNFTLSEGATAWVNSIQQQSAASAVNFSSAVTYQVVAEDGVTAQNWTVTVVIANEQVDPVISNFVYSDSHLLGNGQYTMSARITDNTEISSVRLMYRPSMATDYRIETLTGSSNNYDYTFQDSDFDALGMMFYLEATDPSNNVAQSEVVIVGIEIPSDTETVAGLKSSLNPLDYSIIAMPFQQASVSAIFADLGSYDEQEWRLATYSGGSEYQFFPDDFTQFVPGKGYWFMTNRPVGFTLSDGVSVAADQDNPFTIQLRSGWNMIGNPYPFDLNWQEVVNHNQSRGLSVQSLVTFVDRQYNTDQSTLSKYQGALLYAAQSMTIEVPVHAKSSNTRKSNHLITATPSNSSWQMPLHLSNQSLTNSVAMIGMDPKAEIALDPLDWQQLPRLNSYLDITFEEELSRSIVPYEAQYAWSFTVNTNMTDERVSITWNKSAWASDVEVQLFDVDKMKLVDMRQQASYSFNPSSKSSPFKLLYGGLELLADELNYAGSPFPNPATHELSIPVFIGANGSSVSFKLYDITGRVAYQSDVSGLSKGYHESTLDLSSVELRNSTIPYLLQCVIESDGKIHNFVKKILIKP